MEESNPLSDNLKMPPIALGTYRLQEEPLKKMLMEAFQIGYRNFDAASFYQNEIEVGQVIKDFPRDEIFVTSKVWHDSMGYNQVLSSFERSLNQLQLDGLDLFLIHWPHPHDLIMESLEALSDLKSKNKIKHYGVSNFTIHHLKDAIDAGFKIECNQVEYHPYLNQEELLDFCNHHKIKISAYCPIARGKVGGDSVLKEIAAKYEKSPVQVTLRWHIQKGICPLPKTAHLQRLEENFDVFNFNLSDAEMVQINQLNKNERIIDQAWSHFDY